MKVAVIGAGAVGRGHGAGTRTPVMTTLCGVLKPFEHGAVEP